MCFIVLCAGQSFGQLNAQFSANQTSGCSPLAVSFTDASTGNPNSWNWDFGDGNTSTQQNPSHNYTAPGTYTVTLTVGGGSGTDTEIKTSYIIVFNGPTAGFTTLPDTVCSGGNVTFTSTSVQGDGAITQYTWSFNDGNPSQTTTTSTITHPYINAGSAIDSVIPNLLITDANGCNSTVNGVVYILPSANADFTIGSISSCVTPVTVNFQNNSTNTNIFAWDFGDASSGTNNTSTLAQPSHVYNSAGSYLVTLIAGTGACVSTDTFRVDIQPPTAAFNVSDTAVCLHDYVFFTNTSTPAGIPIFWNFGEPASGSNNSSTAETPSHQYLNPGTYTVTLTVSAGSCTSTSTRTITVRPLPSPLFYTSTPTTGCSVPFTVSFADTVSSLASWSWNFGDPGSGASNISSLQNPSHAYNSFGIYTVSLTVVDIFGCRDSITRNQYIQIIEPTVNLQQADSGCVGSTFPFTAVVTSPADPNITSYDWNFGDGTGNITTTTNNTTHQFNTVGIFDVTVTIHTSTGCTATVTKTGFIKIGTQPNANFSATPTTICFQENVQFTDLTAAPVTGWLWNFGDGGSSTAQNPNHQYQLDTSGTADPFDVTLIAFYNGCPDTIQQQDLITVLSPLPYFTIQYDCANPFTVAFTNNSGGATSYQWDFGDASGLSSVTSPTHVYATTGTYNVALTATSTTTGCVIDTILPVTITNPSAVMNLSATQACHTATINVIGSGSQDVSSLTWTFGEGIAGVRDTSHTADTLHIYNNPGYYLITLSVVDIHGCLKVDTQTVHIIGPIAGFTASPLAGCTPVNVTFTDTSHTEGSAITQWIWNYGVGSGDTTSLSGTVSHTYGTSGNYNITLTVVDANGCSSSHTSPNFIHPSSPDATILTTDTIGCRNIGQVISANAGANAATPITYDWTFGDGTPVTTTTSGTSSTSTTHNYTANGLYPVHLVVTDNNGCVDSTDQNIFIFTTPASFTVTTTDACVVGPNGIKSAQVTALFHVDTSQYATNYNWDLTIDQNPAWQSEDYTQTFSDVAPGTYPATLILTNSFGCVDTATQPGAIVIPGPTGSFSFTPSTGCRPLTVQFTGVASGSSTFAWDFSDGTTVNGTSALSISHTYTSVGTYTPTFYLGFQLSNEFCYIPVDTVGDVTVTSLVTADIDSTQLTCVKDGEQTLVSVSVIDPSNTPPYSYTWIPSGIATNGPTAGTFNLTGNGSSGYYFVEVSYGLQGCSATDSIYIDYCPCSEDSVIIPNVFTPNPEDNANLYYHIDNLCPDDRFRIVIYNRWGKKMYESNNIDFMWDGLTEGGTEASEGTYYYIMTTHTGEKHGWIELIRNQK